MPNPPYYSKSLNLRHISAHQTTNGNHVNTGGSTAEKTAVLGVRLARRLIDFALEAGSAGRNRTYNQLVNSELLYL